MGNTENVIQFPFRSPGATDDAEQDFVYSGPAGFDRWDLFYPFAPKPMLIWPSDRDFYATYSPDYLKNGWEEFQRLKRVYQMLDHAERSCLGGHALATRARLRQPYVDLQLVFALAQRMRIRAVQDGAAGRARAGIGTLGDRHWQRRPWTSGAQLRTP